MYEERKIVFALVSPRDLIYTIEDVVVCETTVVAICLKGIIADEAVEQVLLVLDSLNCAVLMLDSSTARERRSRSYRIHTFYFVQLTS